MPRVAVIQSSYIPWKGYFDIIHEVDVFVFYDDVQYSKGNWRNRNKIKTHQGTLWLTIPVGTREDRLICEVEIKDKKWATKHWRTLQQSYSKAPYFRMYRDRFEEIYRGRSWGNLSDLNQHLIKFISEDLLGIRTEFRDSREFSPVGSKQERLLDLLDKVGAADYLSGPAAIDYIDPVAFADAEIGLHWKDYSGYPTYPQFCPPFTHGVSVLDLLFQVGPRAPDYIWGWRTQDGRNLGVAHA